MKSFKKQAVVAALAFAAVAAASAPALAQYAGLPYGAHRAYGPHPNQITPRARAYGYSAPGAFYDYAAPGAYYDYAPNYGNPPAGVPSQFYQCPPKCW
jgi:hypothetical protein